MNIYKVTNRWQNLANNIYKKHFLNGHEISKHQNMYELFEVTDLELFFLLQLKTVQMLQSIRFVSSIKTNILYNERICELLRYQC